MALDVEVQKRPLKLKLHLVENMAVCKFSVIISLWLNPAQEPADNVQV